MVGAMHRIVALVLALLPFSILHCSQSDAPPAIEAPSHADAAQQPLAVPSAAVLPQNDGFVMVAKLAKASVVNISSARKIVQKGEGQQNPLFEDPFFRRFFGEEFQKRFNVPKERKEQGLGSGLIVSPDGYIVTNNHVVEQAEDIKVLMPDKRSLKAKVIGTDPKTDVAVIK